MRHLGNFVDSTLSDSLDCRYKRSMFIGYVNKLISKFGHLQPHILINLFKAYCCFLSSPWRFNTAGFKSCTTACSTVLLVAEWQRVRLRVRMVKGSTLTVGNFLSLENLN